MKRILKTPAPKPHIQIQWRIPEGLLLETVSLNASWGNCKDSLSFGSEEAMHKWPSLAVKSGGPAMLQRIQGLHPRGSSLQDAGL